MIDDRTYKSAIEVATTIGVPVAWLVAEARAGRLPSLLVGRRRLFEVGVVREVLAGRARGQAPESTRQCAHSTSGKPTARPSRPPSVGPDGRRA